MEDPGPENTGEASRLPSEPSPSHGVGTVRVTPKIASTSWTRELILDLCPKSWRAVMSGNELHHRR